MPDDPVLADIAGHTMIDAQAAPADGREEADTAPPAPEPAKTPREAAAPVE